VAIGDNMSKRDQGMVGVAFVAVALAAAYWWFIFNPRGVALDQQAQHVEQLEGKNRLAKSEMAKGTVAELQRQAIEYQRNLEVMRQLVPMGNEVPALLDQVSTSARRVGLEIATVEPEPVIAGDQFDTYRYKMTVIGSYHTVAEFLTNVGSLRRIVAPVNLTLAPSNGDLSKRVVKKGESLLQTNFEIQTYVAKSGLPAAAPVKSGA
jgi:type IV pilus assembly protein PilO